MCSKTVNLIVRHSGNNDFRVEIAENPENPHTHKVEKDSRTNENLQINCTKCHESIQLKVFFESNNVDDVESFWAPNSPPFVKCEPEVVIKKEEDDFEIPMVEEEDEEQVSEEADDENDEDFTISDSEDDLPIAKLTSSSVVKEGKQTLYKRKYGNQEEIITNYDLSKKVCDICGYKKRTNASLWHFMRHRAHHFIEKEGVGVYKCIGCQKKFDTLDKIRFHTRTCAAGLTLVTEQQKTGTLKQRKPAIHWKDRVPEGIVLPENVEKFPVPFYKCVDQPDGSKIWIEKSQSTKGLRISNFDTRLLTCDLCETTVKYRSMYIRHRKLHLFQQENDDKCLGCDQIFPTADDRVAHTYFCPKWKSVDITKCSACGFVCGGYQQLRSHIHSNHGKNKEAYNTKSKIMCHICSQEVRRSKMYAHLLRHEHPEGRPYACAHCDRRFSGRNNLKIHLIKFHFKSMAEYQCHVCPLCFKGRQEYEKHMYSRHKIGKNQNVTCKLCQKVLANDSSLHAHNRAMHTDASEKQKFECPHCEKFFFKKRNLEAHIPTHLPESERPFKCWCGRGYATRDKLTKHNLEHTDPTKLLSVCSVCGKAMKSKQSLKVHMRIHTGEQPYECNFCSRKFADRGNYRVHMKQHEKELGLKLTFTPEERRLMKLHVLKPDQMLENPGRSGTEEVNQIAKYL
ncbi:zinc finger protein 568-like [Culicoides brevitarsis]|uniref:zinc finger protein 568-like n=1 Tax=Culicoides brevitarsis TaxID=469753 RepID=UPI00307C0BDA